MGERGPAQYVAFLRGMNVGGHRITNAELARHFSELGFENVAPFLASGNVAFESASESTSSLPIELERELAQRLGYEVPVFLRSGAEVREIAHHQPFSVEQLSRLKGKPQVALLAASPTKSRRQAVLKHASDKDALAIRGRELYWLPQGGLSESNLDLGAIEKLLGSMTVRTHRTIERLAKRLAAD